MQVGGDHREIIVRLTDIRNQYWQTTQTLMEKYSWKVDDARIGIFAKCMNNFEPVMFSLIFEKEQLRKPEYQARFSKDHKTPPIQKEIDNICGFYLMYQQMALCDLLFSAIESSFRVFVRAIDPNACNNATDSFQSVYRYLLNQTNTTKYEPLLNLWRLIRNTQHNNGVYIDPRHPQVDIVYKDKTYQFINNTFFKGVDMNLLLDMSEESRDMIQDIIESEVLSNVTEIIDPTYHPTLD
jgi:hypothetical protein